MRPVKQFPSGSGNRRGIGGMPGCKERGMCHARPRWVNRADSVTRSGTGGDQTAHGRSEESSAVPGETPRVAPTEDPATVDAHRRGRVEETDPADQWVLDPRTGTHELRPDNSGTESPGLFVTSAPRIGAGHEPRHARGRGPRPRGPQGPAGRRAAAGSGRRRGTPSDGAGPGGSRHRRASRDGADPGGGPPGRRGARHRRGEGAGRHPEGRRRQGGTREVTTVAAPQQNSEQ